MCGRATLVSPVEDVVRLFEAEPIDIGPPRYNIAPTQPILTVKRPHELAMMRWGLIPWWAKPDEAKKIGARCIQARAETVQRQPAFRDAFERHRCLVVVDGFFEWKTLSDGRRVPHHVHRSRHEPFVIAGLWDTWRPDKETERLHSCTVITTRAKGPIRDLHDRMPLVLPESQWDAWLTASAEQAAELLRADTTERANELIVAAVSTWVNDAKHDDPRCIEPVPIEPPAETAGDQPGFAFEAPRWKKAR